MKQNNVATVAVVAVGTAALTIMTFWPGSMEAGGEADANAARLAKPKFVQHGVEMTLEAKGGVVLKAGDQPVFELTAINTCDQAAETSVSVSVWGTAPADALSRTPRMPVRIWECDQFVSLEPKETKTFALDTRTALPTNSLVSVLLQEPKPTESPASGPGPAKETSLRQVRLGSPPGMVLMTFSTAVPKAQPILISQK